MINFLLLGRSLLSKLQSSIVINITIWISTLVLLHLNSLIIIIVWSAEYLLTVLLFTPILTAKCITAFLVFHSILFVSISSLITYILSRWVSAGNSFFIIATKDVLDYLIIKAVFNLDVRFLQLLAEFKQDLFKIFKRNVFLSTPIKFIINWYFTLLRLSLLMFY
jgi:hypothetical protein